MTNKPFYNKLLALLGDLRGEVEGGTYMGNINPKHVELYGRIGEMVAEITVRKTILAKELRDRQMLFDVDYASIERRVLAEMASRYVLKPYIGVAANSRQYKIVNRFGRYSGVDGRCRLNFEPDYLFVPDVADLDKKILPLGPKTAREFFLTKKTNKP